MPDDTVEGLIKKCTAFGGPGLPSSMMYDVLAGRAMEVEVSGGPGPALLKAVLTANRRRRGGGGGGGVGGCGRGGGGGGRGGGGGGGGERI